MSTRSNIGYKNKKDGKIHYVYCHWDGYYSAVGRELFEDFNDYKKAKKLVEAGDMSTPTEPYTSKGEDFEDLKPKIVEKMSQTFDNEYAYVFVDGEWLATDNGRNFRPLSELV